MFKKNESLSDAEFNKINVHVEIKNGHLDGARFNRFVLVALDNGGIRTIAACKIVELLKAQKAIMECLSEAMPTMSPVEFAQLAIELEEMTEKLGQRRNGHD